MEAHAVWAKTDAPLKLRDHCQVASCRCRCYVGIVWEAPISA